MPVYEFACRECNKDFEKIVPASQRDSVQCPSCGNAHTLRKISLAAPVRVASAKGTGSMPSGEGCGASSCCGGGCGMGN